MHIEFTRDALTGGASQRDSFAVALPRPPPQSPAASRPDSTTHTNKTSVWRGARDDSTLPVHLRARSGMDGGGSGSGLVSARARLETEVVSSPAKPMANGASAPLAAALAPAPAATPRALDFTGKARCLAPARAFATPPSPTPRSGFLGSGVRFAFPPRAARVCVDKCQGLPLSLGPLI